jgi:hypothetical protein
MSDHSILSVAVGINKLYLRTTNPDVTRPLRRQTEDYWVRWLETPYNCNDNIDGMCILSNHAFAMGTENIFEQKWRILNVFLINSSEISWMI